MESFIKTDRTFLDQPPTDMDFNESGSTAVYAFYVLPILAIFHQNFAPFGRKILMKIAKIGRVCWLEDSSGARIQEIVERFCAAMVLLSNCRRITSLIGLTSFSVFEIITGR